MLSKEELEATHIIKLAVLCQKVADNPSVDKDTAAKAEKMKWEWAELVSREPILSAKQNEQIQNETAALKKRMVELLITF